MSKSTDPPQESRTGKSDSSASDTHPPQIQVDESKCVSSYANFCRVTGTPEELIIDFALNSQPMGIPPNGIQISQRIILNFFTAKRLMAALQMSLQRHEATFGVLETNVQKRVIPSAQRQTANKSP